jgi:hypothetical protein
MHLRPSCLGLAVGDGGGGAEGLGGLCGRGELSKIKTTFQNPWFCHFCINLVEFNKVSIHTVHIYLHMYEYVSKSQARSIGIAHQVQKYI